MEQTQPKKTKKSAVSKAALVIVSVILVFSICALVFGQEPSETQDDFSPIDSNEPSDDNTADDPVVLPPQDPTPIVLNHPEPEPQEEQPEQDSHGPPEDETDAADDEPPDESSAVSEETQTLTVRASELDKDIYEKLDAIAKDYNCVAVSMVVFDGERDYFTYEYGFADLGAKRPINMDTKFRVASLSKFTSAMIAMSLSDAGLLDIDADISEYLGYEVKNPNYPDIAITSRTLMQHTSSIYDSSQYLTERFSYKADSTQRLLTAKSTYRDRTPGELFEYSDFGLIVLGAVCEKISDMLFDSLAQEKLFKPLKIDAAYASRNLQDTSNVAAIYDSKHSLTRSVAAQIGSGGRPAQEHNTAQGGLMISPLDYAKILVMLTNGGTSGGVRILSEDAVREIHITDVEGEFYEQGLVTRFEENAFMGEGVYWHTGSAYGTFAQYIYCLDTGRVAVVVTTGATTDRRPNDMVKVCSDLIEQVWRR